MSTMSRVRTAISQSHDAIEQTDFAKSLLDGRVSRLSYACYLSQMHKVHATLEATVLRCPEIAAFFLAEMVRTPVIVRDLLELGYQAESFPEMPATQALTGQLANWSRTSPQALLGCIYILEGSRMGSLMIAKPLAAALGLPAVVPGEIAAGVEYHLDGAALTPKRVRQLKESIDHSNLSTEQEQQLVMGATGFMDLLIDLYTALSPTTGSAVPSPSTCPMQGKSTKSAPRAFQALPVSNAASEIAGKSGTPVVNNAVHATDGDVGSIVRTDRQLKSA